MPKVKTSLVSVWIKNYPELNLLNEEVFCKACAKAITCERKSQIDQHVKTSKHLQKTEEIRKSKVSQLSLLQSLAGPSSSKLAHQQEFNSQLCDALISANIPLNKVQNPKFRSFLEKFCKLTVPHESTLRKNYVTPLYNNVIAEIKSQIKDNFFYIIVDETTDAVGRYIVNLLIGVLNENILPKSYLICTKQLEKTNSLEIVRFVNEGLMSFFTPDVLPTEKLLLIVSDAAAYMIKAGSNLKIFYKNIVHLTCLAHGLNRVAEEIRSQFPLINSLIKNIKKVFVKAPLRVQVYKEKLPNIPLPPEPVVTRWGTWLEAANFYAHHYDNIKNVVAEFSECADSIKQCKDLFKKHEITEQLAYIQANYSFLSKNITQLETSQMSLTEAIEVVNTCEAALKSVLGATGNIILNKFNNVISKNEGYHVLAAVSKILLNSPSRTHVNINLNAEQISALKFAPITSVDVERSFSSYKDILTDHRQKFTVENLEKHSIIKWYSVIVNNCRE